MANEIYTYKFLRDRVIKNDDDILIDRDLQSLINNTLYLPNFYELNDPLEFESSEFRPGEHKHTGVVSFCRSITNPLLWSHYARDHKGFAIGYDRSHEFFDDLEIVVYEDYPSQFTRNRIKYSTKPTSWAYEQEDRLIRGNELSKILAIPAEAVKQVIFGARMSESRISKFQKALGDRELDIGVMRVRKDLYGVDVEWIKRQAADETVKLSVNSAA